MAVQHGIWKIGDKPQPLSTIKLDIKINQRLEFEKRPVSFVLATDRNTLKHVHVIKTPGARNVDIDGAFIMGGLPKEPIVRAFRAHISFDDQDVHISPVSKSIPSGRVPNNIVELKSLES